MSRGYQALEVDRAAVIAAMKQAATIEEFQRYQSLHLRVSAGLTVAEIASATGLAESTIHNLHSRVRRGGLEAVAAKGRGGRYRSYLSLEEEKALLAAMEPQAKRGGMIEVSKMHRALEEKWAGVWRRIRFINCCIGTAGARLRRVRNIPRAMRRRKRLLKKLGCTGRTSQKASGRHRQTTQDILSRRSPLWTYQRTAGLLGARAVSSGCSVANHPRIHLCLWRRVSVRRRSALPHFAGDERHMHECVSRRIIPTAR